MNEKTSSALSREIASLMSTPYTNIIYLPSVGSTNSYLKELASQGAAERTAVIAGAQTAGRGRMGRSFYSPSGSGLYMSILLRPGCPAAQAVGITSLAAVSTARALEKVFPVCADIKWVNDIYVGGKKVCGILTEGSVDPKNGLFSYAIVGIGINLSSPSGGFPEEIAHIAGSLSDGNVTDRLRSVTAAAVLDSFFSLYEKTDPDSILREYKRRCVTLGQDVSIVSQGQTVGAGRVLDIAPDFALIVRSESGEITRVSSGEVSIRPAAGNN